MDRGLGEDPDSASARNGWAHPGLAVGGGGEVYTFHQGDSTVLVLAPQGDLVGTIDTGLTEGHGITLTREGGKDYLWIADPGTKQTRRGDALDSVRKEHGQVVKMSLEGEVVLRIERPDHPVYQEGRFAPTAVAVFEEARGGNGDVWVADGYGRSHVHRYSRFDKRGQYLGSIDGHEGSSGAFACPHSIWIDYRKREPELYVADRTNRRVQVYDLDGHFKRAFGQDIFLSPSAFAQVGNDLDRRRAPRSARRARPRRPPYPLPRTERVGLRGRRLAEYERRGGRPDEDEPTRARQVQ